jgi:hypothetical protein
MVGPRARFALGCHGQDAEPFHRQRFATPAAAPVAAVLDPPQGAVNITQSESRSYSQRQMNLGPRGVSRRVRLS